MLAFAASNASQMGTSPEAAAAMRAVCPVGVTEPRQPFLLLGTHFLSRLYDQGTIREIIKGTCFGTQWTNTKHGKTT